MLRCDTWDGRARAKYTFTLPRKAGSVTWQVNYFGTHRGATVSVRRTCDTAFRVAVTQHGAGRADIESVTIEYYVSG